MIKISDYYTEKTKNRLDVIYQDLKNDPEKIKEHGLLFSEENHNLLGLALRHNHRDLASLLIDMKWGLNHFCERNEHVLLSAQGDFLIFNLNKLKNFNLKNASLMWKQVIEQRIDFFVYDKDIFFSFLESCNLKYIKDEQLLMIETFAYKNNTEENPVLDIWSSFKKKNNIQIESHSVFQYLVKLAHNYLDNNYSLDNIVNKKKYRQYLLANKCVSYALENINNPELLDKNPYYYKIVKNFHKTKGAYNFNNILISSCLLKDIILGKHKDIDYLNNNKFISSFNNIIDVKYYPCKLENKNFDLLLSKYRLANISFPKNYSPNLVYLFLESQINILVQNFDIPSECFGNNTLKISLKSYLNNTNHKGSYNPIDNTIEIICGEELEYNLSYNVPKLQKLQELQNKKYISAFQNTFSHEYTHFLQNPINNTKFFEQPDIKNEWKKITKLFSVKHSKDDCLEYLKDIANHNDFTLSEPIILNIKNCLNQFDNNFQKDKNYVISLVKLKNSLNDPAIFQTFELIIKSYHSQNKSSFREEIWKGYDAIRKKIYLNNPAEVHARLVEKVIVDLDTEYSLYYFGMTKPENEMIPHIKPKLKAFNQILVDNLNKYKKQNNKKYSC